MKNIKFDIRYVTPDMISLMRKVDRGITKYQTGIPLLLIRGLVEPDGLYNVRLTWKGKLALRGVRKGSEVIVSQSYKLPQMRGRIGRVLSVQEADQDSAGYDEYGYQIRWPKRIFIVTVKIEGMTGDWCFYKLEDLEGIMAI